MKENEKKITFTQGNEIKAIRGTLPDGWETQEFIKIQRNEGGGRTTEFILARKHIVSIKEGNNEGLGGYE